jgi:accessory gene regulator protein AgrB
MPWTHSLGCVLAVLALLFVVLAAVTPPKAQLWIAVFLLVLIDLLQYIPAR